MTVVMVTPTRRPVIATIAPARRPVIAVMVASACRGTTAGMLVALGAQDLSSGGVNLHVDPVVQLDTVGQQAMLGIEIDLGDVRSTLSLQSHLLRLNEIDARLQQG
jgi:hypothetical protein